MITEQELIPYFTSKLPLSPWLILSPHPDDETIGMGGTIILANRQNFKIWEIIITDGSLGGDSLVRKKEAEDAREILGIEKIIWWDVKDRSVYENQDIFLKKLPEVIDRLKPNTIFIPSIFEFHPDHRATTLAGLKALQEINYKSKIWLYEISRQGEVNRLIDITKVIGIKEKAIKVYYSQIAQRPYHEVAIALNRARAYTLPNNVKYAEGFWEFSKGEDMIEIKKHIEKYESNSSLNTEYNPLVSVIIRTKDRPELLKDALRSIADQTYKNIEAVVVNDGGEDVGDIVNAFKGKIHKVKYIYHEENKGRSAAANSGIYNAEGELLTLLDDDDILLPEAISILVKGSKVTGAVYGKVDAILYKHDGDKELVTKFGSPFSRQSLFVSNYIPTCGFLFKKNLAFKINGFDQEFDRLEDWDFIFRLSQVAQFLFIPEKVAIYRFFNRGYVLEQNHIAEAPWRTKFYEKHINIITPEFLTRGFYDFLTVIRKNIEDLHVELNSSIQENKKLKMEKDELLKNIEDLHVELNSFIHENRTLLENINKLNMEKDELLKKIDILSREKQKLSETLNEIFSSISWRITHPVRKLGVFLRKLSSNTMVDRGLEVIKTEGVKIFLLKSAKYIQKRIVFKRKINIPILEHNMLYLNTYEPFSLDKEIMVKFTAREDKLNIIDVLTVTYKRKNAPLELCVFVDGKLKRKVLTKKIADNDFTRFKFKPIQKCKNKLITINLKSKGKPSAGILYNKKITSPHFEIYYNKIKINGSINISIYHDIKIRDEYDLWIIKNEPIDVELKKMHKDIDRFEYKPKISIIMPTWNTDKKWLEKAIESVANQIYPNWELCIADGASTNPDVKKVLDEYSRKDKRIKVKYLPENLGIAGNSNEALKLATGEFIGLLDHDDELTPFALYEVVKLLNKHKDVDFIYSDEDKIDKNNIRKDPFFKPDYSPDMFLSCNYICHFTTIRKSIIDKIGGFREGYDGSQDYDLFLRAIEHTDKIAHIPKILYHWRMIDTSAAASNQAKPYAYVAAKKALTDAMKRRNIDIDGVYDGMWIGSYRVKYKIENNPEISIIIPNKDNVNILKRCITSILEKTIYDNYKIIVIENNSNNQSTFEYYKEIEKHPKINILHYERPFNYSAINNYAVSKTKSEFILFLNNDIEVIFPKWLSAMVEHIQRKEVGAVGAKLLYPNNKIQHAGLILGTIGVPPVVGHAFRNLPDHAIDYFGMVDVIRNYSAVTGACMLTKKSLFEEVGGFDEINLPIAFNDVDYCLKLIEKNFLIVYTPYAALYHHESASRGYEDTPEKKQRLFKEANYMRKKWGKILDNDPYYNPNLTREKEDFSIRV